MINADKKDIVAIRSAPKPNIIIGGNNDDIASSTKFAFMIYRSETENFLHITSDFEYNSVIQAMSAAQKYIASIKAEVGSYAPVSKFMNLINFSDAILKFIGNSYNSKFTPVQITEMVKERFKVDVPPEFFKDYNWS